MGECTRTMRLEVPADQVWEWLKVPQNAFAVNMFHAEVEYDGDTVEKGSTLRVLHDFFGAHQEMRQSKVLEAREYKVSWGEYLAEEVDAQDSFPHTQSYEVVPVDDTSCDLVNNIKGSYQFPGSKYFGERIFRRYMPHILDDDNHVIAVGCGAIEPSEMKTPKGLLLWPLMTMATSRTKKSTRRDVLQEAQRRQGIEAAKQKLAEGRDDASGDD